MYTPKGELNEELLKVLYENQVIEEIGNCASKEEILNIFGRYMKEMEETEAVDSLAVILSYLEEQDIQLLSEEELDTVAGGMRQVAVFSKEDIVGLLEKNPLAVKAIRGALTVLNG